MPDSVEAIRRRAENYLRLVDEPFAGAGEEEVLEPADLFRSLSPPEFDTARVPEVIGEFAQAMALAAGHAPGPYAYSAVVACSAAIGHRCRVQITPTWSEPMVMWAGLVGTNGSGKSPAMNAALKPIIELQKEMQREYKSDLKHWRSMPKEDRAEVAEPTLEAIYMANATVEACIKAASESGHNMVRHADEGTGWLNSMGRYADSGAAGERGDWLAAWNGAPYSTGRIGRGFDFLESWRISVLYGITPGNIKGGYAEASSDGMLARTLICLLDRKIWMDADYTVDAAGAADRYRQAVEGLAQTQDRTLKLTSEAKDAWFERSKQWREANVELEKINPGLAGFCGKAPAILARISGIFHLLGDGRDGDWISAETMRIADDFMAHAMKMAYVAHSSILSEGSAAQVARAIGSKILRLGSDKVSRRELTKVAPFAGADKDTQSAAIQYLVVANWLLGDASKRRRLGPNIDQATAWTVNPLVHQRFTGAAKEEAEKAQKIREIMINLRKG